MRTHVGARPYECRVCGESFTRKDNMKSHLRTVHMDAGVHVKKGQAVRRSQAANGGRPVDFHPDFYPTIVAFVKRRDTPTAPEVVMEMKRLLSEERNEDAHKLVTCEKMVVFARSCNVTLPKAIPRRRIVYFYGKRNLPKSKCYENLSEVQRQVDRAFLLRKKQPKKRRDAWYGLV